MDPAAGASTLLLILLLVAAVAFFTAAEFTLVALPRARIEARARQGDRRALRVVAALARADELVLAAQLGSSAASLLLGYVIAVAASHWIPRVLPIVGAPRVLAATLALAVAASLHVVAGKQLPKLLAVQRAEQLATRVTMGPLRVFALLVRPFTWMLSGVVVGLARIWGLAPGGLHSLVNVREDIEEDEAEMIRGVVELGETVVREVMTPRTDMVAVPTDVTLDAVLDLVTTEGRSRLPVYEGTIDSVIGVVLAKDLLPILRSGVPAAEFDVRQVMREPYFVPDTKPVDDLLAEFRRQSVHLAIVLDEFGGTYGLVSMEDLLEEIVGDINDEHDIPEPPFTELEDGDLLIDGGAAISEVNERCGLILPEEDFDTLGGYVFGALGRVPDVGDVVAVQGQEGPMELRVEGTEERRVTRVRLARPAPLSA